MNWKSLFRRADIGVGAIRVNIDREMVIDYTVPYYDMVGFTILIRKVKEIDIWKFLNVMEPEVWCCILGAYFISSLLLWVFERYLERVALQIFHIQEFKGFKARPIVLHCQALLSTSYGFLLTCSLITAQEQQIFIEMIPFNSNFPFPPIPIPIPILIPVPVA